MATMLVIMTVFSLMARDLYGDITEDGYLLFPDFVRSFITMFRLFIGEGWHGIMYEAANGSDNTAKAFFMLYTFLVTMLFGQLLVGVIISQYQDVEQVISMRVFSTIERLCQDLSANEKEQLMEDFLAVNYRLMHIHEEIDRFAVELTSTINFLREHS